VQSLQNALKQVFPLGLPLSIQFAASIKFPDVFRLICHEKLTAGRSHDSRWQQFSKFNLRGVNMAEPFLSEIRIMSFVFAPKGWALCNGQLLPINQNQALFSLLGTTFGGDGRVNFALPDNRGRVPIHVGSGHTLGERGGEQAHTLSIAELPQHVHVLNGTGNDSVNTPANNSVLGKSAPQPAYGGPTGLVAMNPASIANVGGSQAHLNMQPFLTLSFCIALQGIFPSPN
jgi:microcystin-dependent protein